MVSPRYNKAKGRDLQNRVAQWISDLTGFEWGSAGSDKPIEARGMGQKGTDVRLSKEVLKLFNYSVECFGKDTLVITKNGAIPIQSVMIGDKVLTHLGRFRKVTKIFKRSINKSICLYGGSSSEFIITTPTHPFEGFYGEWVAAKDVKIFSHIIQSTTCKTEKTKFKLPEKIYHSQNKLPINTPIDKEFMTFIGWYIAEGHCEKGSVNFTLSAEENDIAIMLSEVCKSKFNLNSSILSISNTSQVRIYSTLLSKFMCNIIGTGSRNKKLGEFMFYDKQLLSHLLRSYFLGDGCIGNDFARCETVSRILAYEIQFSLLRYGIFSRVGIAKQGKITPLYSVQISRATLPIFMAMMEMKEYRYEKAHINSDIHFIYAPDKQRLYTKVNSSYHTEKIDVYNLSVEEDETFVIEGGIITHNCKHAASIDYASAINQAKENQLEGTDWLLIVQRTSRRKDKRYGPIVIIDAERFFELLRSKK